MDNNPTDSQLKQALAKMLPETFNVDDEFIFWDGTDKLVLDTELLHICWLIEQTLDKTGDMNEPPELRESELSQYYWALASGCEHEAQVYSASWQQRTIALAKVKGVEIV